MDEDKAINYIGYQKWVINQGEVKNAYNTEVIINKPLPTWKIFAYMPVINHRYEYFYTYDEEYKIEILASSNDRSIIFTRTYTKGPDPDNCGIHLPHDAVFINEKVTNIKSEYYLACPVDGEIVDPDGLIINRTFNNIPNATYYDILKKVTLLIRRL